jgi:hypothetical protein
VRGDGANFSVSLRRLGDQVERQQKANAPFPKPIRAPTHMKHSSTANSMMCARGC